MNNDGNAAVERVHRDESRRILATLIRIAGSFDLAEEAMQEAFTSALSSWSANGIPHNPGAWITATAHRKIIDHSRRRRTQLEKQVFLLHEAAPSQPQEMDAAGEMEMHYPDDRLRLIFTCCHPAVNPESQIALTLRVLGGLTTAEIAKAFLVPESTVAQRLVRAKRKIQEAGIPYEVPQPREFPDRLGSVQAVLYLIFNEGYAAASGESLLRADLCQEAIRLSRLLRELLPAESENIALLALMTLHHSRRDARVRDGELVRLEEQDRSLWHRPEIAEGLLLVEQALKKGPVGPYQLQAAIAALHAEAATANATDWTQIAALYERLREFNASPVVALNQAVAVAMSVSFEEGLRRIDALSELDQYYLFHAARADVLRRIGRGLEAESAYRRAIALTDNRVEQAFLRRQIQAVRQI